MQQKEVLLPAFPRGFHLISSIINQEIADWQQSGLLHIFIKHTSASLSINENADPSVRADMEEYFNRFVPEEAPFFTHTAEGSDDMPAHIKASLLGNSILVPVKNGQLNLGTWQGIYLCEHRNRGGRRKLVLTSITNQLNKE